MSLVVYGQPFLVISGKDGKVPEIVKGVGENSGSGLLRDMSLGTYIPR